MESLRSEYTHIRTKQVKLCDDWLPNLYPQAYLETVLSGTVRTWTDGDRHFTLTLVPVDADFERCPAVYTDHFWDSKCGLSENHECPHVPVCNPNEPYGALKAELAVRTGRKVPTYA